ALDEFDGKAGPQDADDILEEITRDGTNEPELQLACRDRRVLRKAIGDLESALEVTRDGQEAAASLRQPDLAPVADKERRANESFELGDARGERGLGNANAQRGLGEAAGVDDREKLPDVRALYHK